MTGELVERFGLPVAMLLAVSYAVYKATRYVGEHLFEHPGGYISQLVTAHIAFLKTFDQSLASTTRALEEIAVLLRDLRQMREEERAEWRTIRGSKEEP